jgi:thiamine-phosphate diphosphorylase
MPRRLSRPLICVVTAGAVRDAENAAAQDLVTLARNAAGAGVDMVQVREPHLPDPALWTLIQRVIAAVVGTSTAVLVNDRVDVALASGAHGVHLRGDAMKSSRVRSIVPDAFLIGRSVHSVVEARAAEADGGVDYLIFGTVFRSRSKPAGHPVAGVEGLDEVCRAVRLPVIAIGGIETSRVGDAARAGSAGIAAIGMFDEASRKGAIAEVVQQVRHAFGN